MLREAGARTLVDVRSFPRSRWSPHFNQGPLAETLEAAGIAYVHEPALGGRLKPQPGEGRFDCIPAGPFRSYAARMTQPDWQEALAATLAHPAPCFLCSEAQPEECHRGLIAEQLGARGQDVTHLIRPGETRAHQPRLGAETRNGRLYLCGRPVG
jgi:uncharacterized protein (DUF488 family)